MALEQSDLACSPFGARSEFFDSPDWLLVDIFFSPTQDCRAGGFLFVSVHNLITSLGR